VSPQRITQNTIFISAFVRRLETRRNRGRATGSFGNRHGEECVKKYQSWRNDQNLLSISWLRTHIRNCSRTGEELQAANWRGLRRITNAWPRSRDLNFLAGRLRAREREIFPGHSIILGENEDSRGNQRRDKTVAHWYLTHARYSFPDMPRVHFLRFAHVRKITSAISHTLILTPRARKHFMLYIVRDQERISAMTRPADSNVRTESDKLAKILLATSQVV